jgi:hypothetical protein
VNLRHFFSFLLWVMAGLWLWGTIDDIDLHMTYKYMHIYAYIFLDLHTYLQIQILHGIAQALFAIVIYKFLLPHRGTTSAYLLGWGFLIPLACWLPFWFIEAADLSNRFVKLPSGSVMTCVVFRCIEAMYDTTTPTQKKELCPILQFSFSISLGRQD